MIDSKIVLAARRLIAGLLGNDTTDIEIDQPIAMPVFQHHLRRPALRHHLISS